MSRYTTELRYLIEGGYDIGLARYPIFDELYRPVLNQKIMDHFWFREIGAETAARFTHYLNVTMSEIMPKYNRLYATEALIVNPFYNMDLEETQDRQASGTSESQLENTQTGSTDSRTDSETTNIHSDTPQGLIQAVDIERSAFASAADRGRGDVATSGHQTAASTGTTSGTSTSMEDYTKHIRGTSGVSQAALLQEFRDTFLEIDRAILKDLEICFMGVW